MADITGAKKIVNRKEHCKTPFLEEFKKHGTIGPACVAANVDRRTIQRWRHEDPAFNEKYQSAELNITEKLERTAMTRALTTSDTLLIFLLKARHPEKYKERFTHELDPKLVQAMVTQFITAVKKHAPEFCPHCKSHLGLSNKIAKELSGLSARMAAM